MDSGLRDQTQPCSGKHVLVSHPDVSLIVREMLISIPWDGTKQMARTAPKPGIESNTTGQKNKRKKMVSSLLPW